MKGIIKKISGPVVHAELKGAVNDLVKVGTVGLLGEIIELRGPIVIIQVYEDTQGLRPGEPVVNVGMPLSVELGPGLLGKVFDGTQRPLEVIRDEEGVFIPRGVNTPALDRTKTWAFIPSVKKGDEVEEGAILGIVQETSLLKHRILVPAGISGKVTKIDAGEFTVTDTIATIGKSKVTLMQNWPVRKARKIAKRLASNKPLITGQRILDFMFPVVKGGVVGTPGPFGSGKTVTQQQIAKWCDADVIVYIGCGERGNEMTDVLEEFPELKDPRSGKPLMERTILIANTSNMPVAAREASVYTGIAIAEYFRDQGYAVALMADSTSRWAEAMREIAGRLEEMPGEEGYPAYLAKRLAEFYERAGIVKTLANKEGSVTVIGAVSPAGGDFSEPVTQNTLRIVRCFWALDAKLASRRHYPAINWLQSYSLYDHITSAWFNENVSDDWEDLRSRTLELLQKESELQEIVQLVGLDSLPVNQQALLFVTKMIREDFLQQNAFHDVDTYCQLQKQHIMIRALFLLYDEMQMHVTNLNLSKLRSHEIVATMARLKYEKNKTMNAAYEKKLNATIKAAVKACLE